MKNHENEFDLIIRHRVQLLKSTVKILLVLFPPVSDYSRQTGGLKLPFLHATVLFPFLFAVFVPFLYKKWRQIHTGWFVLIVPLLLFLSFAGRLPFDPASDTVTESVSWIPRLSIHFTLYLDGLTLLLALIITGIGFLVVLYSIFYMSKEREALHNFYIYLLCFMGAMLGIVLSDNLLVLYTFWEITSISSFLLIAYWYQRKKSRQGAVKSLLITVSGGFAMLLGFLLMYAATGTFSIREITASAETLAQHPLFTPALILVLLGAFTKSAQFPFHIWLPDAMEAPTPISAYLHSATMVKAGVYLVARLTPVFGGHPEWFWIVTAGGIATLFWGSFMAIRQIDLKAMLAFSTVSQLGLMMSLLGVGSMALSPNAAPEAAVLFAMASAAALFHLFNHSIFKGCLFMVIGIIDHETGTRDIRKLGGLMSLMPISFTLTIIGAFSMAGLPPFSGFLSKEMFFSGMLAAFRSISGWLIVLPVLAWLASVFTFVYCMILVFKTFTGPGDPTLLDKKAHEASAGMLISPSILALLIIVFFFVPNAFVTAILEPAMHSVYPVLVGQASHMDLHVSHWHGWNAELFMTIGVVIAGTYLFRHLSRWSIVYEQLPQRFTLNNAFEQGLAGMELISSKITRAYMTGNVRHYLIYIFGFLMIMLGGMMLMGQSGTLFDLSQDAQIHLYEYVLGFAIVASALYMLFATSRINSVIALSAVGYLIALFFVNFRAPDLALTQLVVETISTALFLLCFYFLPKMKKEMTRLPLKVTNLVISIGVGVTLTLLGLYAKGYRVFEPISSFYENSYQLAGARNMVNAILVDFRGFDTMLEIVVLFSAGVGVYTLIKFHKAGRKGE
jgi:multicomponent Na+:H+ antiporter subunit A